MTADIINIFDKKRPIKEKKEEEEVSFEEIIKKNEENKERIKRDREQANKYVKRSYRID
jgi:hypothetical protein